ncbi:MAG: response regulator [Aquabacterium sp.]
MTIQPASLVFGSIELRLSERVLRVEGQAVALGSRGFDLLQALVRKRDRVVTKDELLDEVWPGLVVEENNLQVQISGLRRVLGQRAIATVPGVGYQFALAEGEVQPLPAAPPPPPAVAAAPARLLVADDNRVNRLLLCRSLDLMGHQVDHADNGRLALEMLRAQPYDLLLLDLAMPELDGFGLLQARSTDAVLCEVAVIVTSALGGVAPVARCIELGADDFLHKPVDPWLLRARVDASLQRKRQRDQQAMALRQALPGGPAAAAVRADATVLAVRLQGLTQAAQAPAATWALLNDWCTLVFDAIQGQGGEVAQFSGDAVLAIFDSTPDAVRAAQDLVQLLRQLAEERGAGASSGTAADARTGIGMATGPVLMGTATVAGRATRACIGAAVTRAWTLAAECGPAGQPFLVDDSAPAGPMA